MFAPLKASELQRGTLYALFALFILPFLLELFPFPHWVLDCAAGVLNAVLLSVLLGHFLRKNLKQAVQKPWHTGLFILLGFGLWYGFTLGFQCTFPNYVNLNDAAVLAQLQQSGIVGIICTVLFVPVFEELLFRGLLFRGLYDRRPLLAWGICCLLFPLVHILSYWGQYTFFTGLLAFFQYLPAGMLLCFAYRQTGTIFTPMVIHLLINLFSLLQGGSLWH